MVALYNEIDPEAVAVLRELIASNVIAPGEVDGRSIKELSANDVRGFDQVHLFAGAGLWSVAARIAGWPDNKPLWSASCPCQPFSAAGKQGGIDDPRHLWPDLYRIIRTARDAGQPIPVLVGEQVAGAAGYDWFDGVRTDLAREGIAARTVDIPACTVDAPHERNRLYWVGVEEPDSGGETGRGLLGSGEGTGADSERAHDQSGRSDGRPDGSVLADSDNQGRLEPLRHLGEERGRPDHGDEGSRVSPLGHAIGARLEGQRGHGDRGTGWSQPHRPAAAADGGIRRNGSWWSDGEWILCHDGKARRAKPGVPMLVDGMVGRASVWRLAGNSIVSVLAAEVLKAILETEGALR